MERDHEEPTRPILQYENRYLAQQRRINNTQQSWARSEYDVPPHLESASTANRGTGNNIDAPVQAINKKIAPIPGCLHPDAPGMHSIGMLPTPPCTGLQENIEYNEYNLASCLTRGRTTTTNTKPRMWMVIMGYPHITYPKDHPQWAMEYRTVSLHSDAKTNQEACPLEGRSEHLRTSWGETAQDG